MSTPVRGEIWLADLDPVMGHEQGGRRPVLVVSHDRLNLSGAGLVIIVPITSKVRPVASHVRVAPAEGGLELESDILCESIRCISKERLLAHRGAVSRSTLERVEEMLRRLLKL